MFKRSLELLSKWISAPFSRRDLDALLSEVPGPESLLRRRLEWLTDLIQWIRSPGAVKSMLDFQSGQPQALRVKYMLLILERNPEWKKHVALCLRSILRDTSALDLFVNTGLPGQNGFAAEMLERIHYKILPQAPEYSNLASFFSQTFRREQDYRWIEQMDRKVFEDILELFHYQENGEKSWNTLVGDAKDAILLLSTQIRGAGLSPAIRRRLVGRHFRSLPFFALPDVAEALADEQDSEKRLVLALQLEKLLDQCHLALTEVYDHLNEYGVSISIVFMLDRIESQMKRIQNLLDLILIHVRNPEAVSGFIANLMMQNVRRHKVGALLSDNLSLISRKIAERSAETGEHYITRNRQEYFAIQKSAIGGGVLTAFTTLIKFFIYKVSVSIFFSGFLASVNYAASFVIIQLTGCTLATKQPAMTAPALAAKMHDVKDPAALENLVDEIVHLMRSQFVAILGNIYSVIPCMALISIVWYWTFGSHLLSAEKAHHTLESFSILGGTAPFAAFTGILLWLSSLIAGWVDNWFAYHRLTSAISQNRRINFVFGESGAKKIALYFRKNISGFAANISLGFMLGLIPSIMIFLGLPLDVRHVTLSSASLASATVSLGLQITSTWEFWAAVLGIASCGVLNVLVAFSMAMFVAIRARKIKTPDRHRIYQAVLHRLRRQPLTLFYPKNPAPRE